MDLFPFAVALFPNLGRAFISNFNCHLIDKEEIIILFPIWQVTSIPTGQAVKFLKRFIHMMMSGSHVYISHVEGVFMTLSCSLFTGSNKSLVIPEPIMTSNSLFHLCKKNLATICLKFVSHSLIFQARLNDHSYRCTYCYFVAHVWALTQRELFHFWIYKNIISSWGGVDLWYQFLPHVIVFNFRKVPGCVLKHQAARKKIPTNISLTN